MPESRCDRPCTEKKDTEEKKMLLYDQVKIAKHPGQADSPLTSKRGGRWRGRGGGGGRLEKSVKVAYEGRNKKEHSCVLSALLLFSHLSLLVGTIHDFTPDLRG